MGPSDPGIAEKTGFAAVEAFSQLKIALADLAKNLQRIYTFVPHADDTGYPHARESSDWLTKPRRN